MTTNKEMETPSSVPSYNAIKTPIRLMSQEEKTLKIQELQDQLKTEKDLKKRDAIHAKIKYLRKSDQKKQKQKERYLKKHKDTIQKKCEQKLHQLNNLESGETKKIS